MKWLLLLCSFLLFSLPAFSQDTTGNLEGVVFEENGDPLVGANVRITGESIMDFRGGATNENGRFRVLALPVGVVQIEISFVGFETVIIPDLRIKLGETVRIDKIELKPADITLEGVVVTGERPAIDFSTTTTGTSLSSEDFSSLPIEREISSVVAMMPHANASYLGDQINIGGATGNENAYYYDGVNTTSPLSGESVAELPYNFVKEIQIKTGGFEAEFGKAMGGIVNVLTESGSNSVKASAFSFLSNNSLSNNARKSFQDQISTDNFLRYDVGFGIGGPIKKDRLWYYAAYNRKVESEEVIFDAVGVRQNKQVSNIYAGKLTWRAQEGTNVDLSVFGNPSTGDRVGGAFFWSIPGSIENEDTMLGRTEGGTHTIAASVNHVVGDDILLEGRASWYKIRDLLEPATERGMMDPFLVDDRTGAWSGGYPGISKGNQRRTSTSLKATWFAGRHTVKAGVEFEDNHAESRRIIRSETGPNVDEMTGLVDPFSGPPGVGVVAQQNDSTWMAMFMNDGALVDGRNYTAFLQTNIELTNHLSASLGVRWDTQAFDASDYDYHYSLPGQLQPRLGLIYEPGESGDEKVFAHVGRFYVQVPISASVIYMVPPVCYLAFFDHDPVADPTGGGNNCAAESHVNSIDGNLSGMYQDAVSIGYQRMAGASHRLGITGTLRRMGEVLTTARNQSLSTPVLGNPGSGRLDFMPNPIRNYAALELTWDRIAPGSLQYGVSYVLSQNRGNYTGMYGSDTGQNSPNAMIHFGTPEQVEGSGEGPLPNDRTHVLKLRGTYRMDNGVVAGTYFTVQSGTPLSEKGGHPWLWFDYVIVGGRGGLGRTPAIWDLNFRFSYDLNRVTKQRFEQKLILDVLHAFSQREVVDIESSNKNPNFMDAKRFQLPMTLRLGVEMKF